MREKKEYLRGILNFFFSFVMHGRVRRGGGRGRGGSRGMGNWRVKKKKREKALNPSGQMCTASNSPFTK